MIYWAWCAKRLLLRLVRALSEQRLEQLDGVLPVERPLINEAQVKEALLDAAAEAALDGRRGWLAGYPAGCIARAGSGRSHSP